MVSKTTDDPRVGAAIGVAVLASIFASHGSDLNPQSYGDRVVTAVCIVVVSAVVARLVPSRIDVADCSHAAAPGSRWRVPARVSIRPGLACGNRATGRRRGARHARQR